MFLEFLSTLTRRFRFAQRASMARVPSVDASSITMTSPRNDDGNVASTAARHDWVSLAPLWHGMMIETADGVLAGFCSSQSARSRTAVGARRAPFEAADTVKSRVLETRRASAV